MDFTQNIGYISRIAVAVFKAVMDKRNAEKITSLKMTSGEMYFQTKDYLEDMLQDAGECAQVIVNIFSDALRDAGQDIPKARGMVKPEIEDAIRKEIEKCLTIIPYTPQD